MLDKGLGNMDGRSLLAVTGGRGRVVIVTTQQSENFSWIKSPRTMYFGQACNVRTSSKVRDISVGLIP